MKYEDVEKAKLNYKNAILKRIGITLIVIIVIALIVFFSFSHSQYSYTSLSLIPFFSFFAFFSLIAILLIGFSIKKERRAYYRAYKSYFVYNSLTNIFTNLTYERDYGIKPELLRSTGMINLGDRYSANDYVCGKYKDVSFTQSDVHIEVEHTDSDGNTSYSTLFKGRFMIFEFPKSFAYRLEVVEKGFRANLIPKNNRESGKKIERVDLESNEFNDMFKTYAEDGFEAFYILDPALMNNILELGQKYSGQLLLCFLDNHLIVGLRDGKDAFEPPSVFKALNKDEEMAKVSREISLVTDFVDQLKLDRKIFK